MHIRFNNKTALVTGTGSGIGAAIAQGLAAAGGRVIVQGIRLEAALKVADAIRAQGGQAHATAGDVADPDAVAAMVAFAVKEGGALNLMVNNAGIGGPAAPVGEYPIDGWRQVMGVNLDGVF